MIDAPTGAGLYLLHGTEPIGNPESRFGQAQHYLGYADCLSRRVGEHLNPNLKSDVKIVNAYHAAGVELMLVRVWEGADRNEERRIKKGNNLPKLCPICRRIRRESHVDV